MEDWRWLTRSLVKIVMLWLTKAGSPDSGLVHLITPKFRLNEIKLFSKKVCVATLARICGFPSKTTPFSRIRL
jgi:hypothetical protein